jgi:hypothetical protein
VEADSDVAGGVCREYDQGERSIKESRLESERGNEEAETGMGDRGTTNPTSPRGARTIEDGVVGGRRGFTKIPDVLE